MKTRFAFAIFLSGLPLVAQANCPAAPDHTAALSGLIAEAQAATSETVGQQLGQEMWALWADAPNEQAQAVLDRGMSKRESFDFLGAAAEFETLIAYCPKYAEGYNQRAFIRFLQQDFEAAVPDLERALELSPNHIAARAGLALTYLQLGRLDAARTALDAALALNPWLSERHLMAKGGPLAPLGEDI